MDKPKILIVDDDKAARELLNIYLSKDIECDILESGNAQEADEILSKGPVDIMLLDIKMRGISGIDVLKKTKSSYPETDILVISAWDSQSVAAQALKEGALDYIPKPYKMDVVVEKVCEILKARNKYTLKPKDK